MKKRAKIGYVGLGGRGRGVLEKCFSQMADVDVVALCDLSEERLAQGKDILLAAGKPAPIMTTEYEELLKNPEIDAIVLMTWWDGRVELAKRAMLAGKYTAMEVGCADTLQECFDLIDTYEKTGVPVMMLENCCYGRVEMMTLNMKNQGAFGELVHCDGAYAHYLADEDLFNRQDGRIPPHYRLPHYVNRNRENYPTHALGPISKVLGLNRGNRMLKLASFASKAVGLKDRAVTRYGEDSEFAKIDYKQGDVVTTMITCENGETIRLTLDTTLPRAYYSRNYTVRGTRGLYTEERRRGFLVGMAEDKSVSSNEAEFFEKFDHPLHREYVALGERGGHNGMDWLVCRAFIESVKNGTNTPIDAYDTALWLAIGPLSEASLNAGSMPVDVPDFTCGKYQSREPVAGGKYALDDVIEDSSTAIFPE